MATANGIPLLWNERRTLWALGKGYNPSTIASAGSWKWDFSFPIPCCFDNSPNGGSKSALLPGSFDLRVYQPYIAFLEYPVFIFVKRGKWLPTETELHTQFIYIARERAPPPSPLRGLAYAEQRQPPPPSEDPAGWEACSEIIANGALFGDRKVTVIYKPYLSKPSIYPRGDTVFYRIEILSDDSQALQLMSSQSAISVTLTREIQSSPFGRAVQETIGKKKLDIDVQTMAYGVSWVDPGPSRGATDEFWVLQGEISIPSKISPDTTMSILEVRYFVNFVVDTTGFIPSNPSLVAMKYPIQIVTHRAAGVAPISRIPPGYEARAVTHPVNALDISGGHLNLGDAAWGH